jgi:membrane protease YdiL (CAAX protease family)
VIALLAVFGIWFRDGGFATAFVARGNPAVAVLAGAGVGVACFCLLWLVRAAGPLRDLEVWQRRMVAGWSAGDAVAVAVFSGLAEEALIRALLQPLLGLVPAAAIFAALHFVPDRKLWAWPLMAMLLGLGLGWVFVRWGYPAAAAAHVVINGLSLTRFRVTAGT